MLSTLSRRAAICESVAEVLLAGVAPLGAVSTDLIFLNLKYLLSIRFLMFPDNINNKILERKYT